MHCRWPGLLQGWGRVEASRCEFQHGDDLLPGHVKPLHDFVDRGPGFELLKDEGDRHARVLENPRATHLSGDAFHGWALGPIENCHSSTLLHPKAFGLGGQGRAAGATRRDSASARRQLYSTYLINIEVV